MARSADFAVALTAWVSDVTEFRLPDDGRKVYLLSLIHIWHDDTTSRKVRFSRLLFPAGT